MLWLTTTIAILSAFVYKFASRFKCKSAAWIIRSSQDEPDCRNWLPGELSPNRLLGQVSKRSPSKAALPESPNHRNAFLPTPTLNLPTVGPTFVLLGLISWQNRPRSRTPALRDPARLFAFPYFVGLPVAVGSSRQQLIHPCSAAIVFPICLYPAKRPYLGTCFSIAIHHFPDPVCKHLPITHINSTFRVRPVAFKRLIKPIAWITRQTPVRVNIVAIFLVLANKNLVGNLFWLL